MLTADLASTFARFALAHEEHEWHSRAHECWLLATILRLHPRLAESAAIRALFARSLTDAHVAEGHVRLAGEAERTCEWAWMLMLCAELARHTTDDDARQWSRTLKPLANACVSRFTSFLPRAAQPDRTGTRANSAFAIALALEYADVANDKRFGRLLRGRAVSWFSADTDAPPDDEDLLSPALMEAECMHRSLDVAAFRPWLDRFLPRLGDGEPASLFVPTALHGSNLSRAWCWNTLGQALPEHDVRRARALTAAAVHLEASLPHVAGDHWLTTFSLLALMS